MVFVETLLIGICIGGYQDEDSKKLHHKVLTFNGPVFHTHMNHFMRV